VVVPAAASAVVVDPTDALMCVGATSGAIFLRALNVAPAADAAAISAAERMLDGHRQAITALVFTLDGKHLVSGVRSPLSPLAALASRRQPITTAKVSPEPRAVFATNVVGSSAAGRRDGLFRLHPPVYIDYCTQQLATRTTQPPGTLRENTGRAAPCSPVTIG
jgi:hypothetical protein